MSNRFANTKSHFRHNFLRCLMTQIYLYIILTEYFSFLLNLFQICSFNQIRCESQFNTLFWMTRNTFLSILLRLFWIIALGFQSKISLYEIPVMFITAIEISDWNESLHRHSKNDLIKLSRVQCFVHFYFISLTFNVYFIWNFNSHHVIRNQRYNLVTKSQNNCLYYECTYSNCIHEMN